jgi:hypothetical protein
LGGGDDEQERCVSQETIEIQLGHSAGGEKKSVRLVSRCSHDRRTALECEFVNGDVPRASPLSKRKL